MPQTPVGRGAALAALGISLIAATAALTASGNAWASAFFYVFAWAGILLVMDGLNHRLSGESLLLDDPGRFGGLFALSIPFWLAYEAANLRLRNWSYQGLPEEQPLRWVGYLLAFGTVLPALEESRRLCTAALPLAKVECGEFRLNDGTRRALVVAGAMFLLLPLAAPEIFFPLLWGAALLVFEPAASRRAPTESWLFEASLGRPEAALAWVAGGTLCGLLWEGLNFWAGGRWTYSLPPWTGPRLFELPLAGYLGFAPLALGAAPVMTLVPRLWDRAGAGERAAWVFMLAAFSAGVLVGIDERTATTFVSLLP